MADTTLEQIRGLIQAHRYQEALASLKSLLKEQPDNNDVRVLLTEVQEKMMLQMQITEMTKRAKGLTEQGQVEEAKKILGEILRIDPENSETKAFITRLSGAAPPSFGQEPGEAELPSLAAFTPEEQPPADGLQELPQLDTFETVPPIADQPVEGDLPSLDAGQFDMPEAAFPPSEETVLDGDFTPMDQSGEAGEQPPFQGFELESPPADEPLWSAAPPEDAPSPSFSAFEVEDSSPPAESTVLAGEAPRIPAMGTEELERIQKYISDGKALLEGGNYQDAIDTWTRVFILDENNSEAQELIDQARDQLTAKQGELDYTLTEAIGAFNAGEFARAKPLLEKVVAAFPGHREATHYLDKIPDQPAAEDVPPAPAVSTFEMDSGVSSPPSASTFEIGGEEPAASREFVFDTGEADTGPPSLEAPPMEGEVPTPGEVDWAGLPPTAVQPDRAQPAPEIAPPPLPPQEFPEEAPKPVREKPARKKPSLAFLLVLVVILPIIGLGIFFLPKLLQSEHDTPIPVAPGPVPTEPASPPPEPDTDAAGVDTRADGGEKPIKDLSVDQLFARAREERSNQRYDEAIALYKEILAREEANEEAFESLRAARNELRVKREEEVRVEQFLRDYNRAVDNFQAEQYRESLRLAWRLVYPDDSMARELGKKENLQRLLQDGYYNWAILNLQYNNVQGARDNLAECLVMAPNDVEARDLKVFTEKYINVTLDASFRDVVRTLTPRKFKETE